MYSTKSKFNNLSLLKPNFIAKYSLYIKSASIYLIASVFSASVKILVNPLLAKNLSHTDYAISGYFSSFSILFLPLLTFMIFAYYQKSYYQISDERRELLTNTIVLTLSLLGTIVSLIILAGLFLFFKITDVELPFWPYALFLIYQIVFNNFLTLLQVNYRLKRESKKYALLTIISSLFWVAFAIVLVVLLQLGAKGSMLSNLIVAIILGIYSISITLTKIEFDFSIFKDILRFCWPLTLSALMWYFLSGIDSAMLEKLNDTKTFGLYNIGLGLSSALGMFYTAIAQTFEPDIYKAIAANKIKTIFFIISIIIIINAIPVFIFILFSKPITYILTAGHYTMASTFAQILSLKNISMGMYYSVLTIVVGFGFTKIDLVLRVLGAIFSIFLYKYLIHNYGFIGAAWGQFISFLFMSTLGILFILYKMKTNRLF